MASKKKTNAKELSAAKSREFRRAIQAVINDREWPMMGKSKENRWLADVVEDMLRVQSMLCKALIDTTVKPGPSYPPIEGDEPWH